MSISSIAQGIIGGVGGRDACTLVFYHIPKTAGMSFTHFLGECYNGCKRISKSPSGGKVGIHSSLTDRHYYSRGGSVVCGFGHTGFYAPFWGMPTKRCVFVTFVRDPLRRVVSHYNHMQRKDPPPKGAQTSAGRVFSNDAFWNDYPARDNEYINYHNFYPWASEFYVRSFSGYTFLDSSYTGVNDTGYNPEGYYNKAIESIERNEITIRTIAGERTFPCIYCVTEEYDKCLKAISGALGVGYVRPVRINVGRKASTSLPPAAQALLAQRNKLDRQIYNTVCSKLA